MKIKYLLIFISIILFKGLSAQTDFRPGFVIKAIGDTLHGEIDYRGDIFMGKTCRYRNKMLEVTEFNPNDIIGFRFIDGKFYVSKTVEGEKQFLEFLIKGIISIYYRRDFKGDFYYLEKENNPLIALPYEEGIRYIDNKPYEYKSTKHIGILTYYMMDAPDLQKRINTIEEPDHKSLISISQIYHQKVCKTDSCIIYEKKRTKAIVHIEAVTGLSHFANYSNPIVTGGIIVNIGLPRVSEKLYLKTGMLLINPLDSIAETEYFNYYPLHLAYIMPPCYRVRPFFSLGFIRPSYSAGVHIRLGKRINVGAQAWANFHHSQNLFLWPTSLINYSYLFSIGVQL